MSASRLALAAYPWATVALCTIVCAARCSASKLLALCVTQGRALTRQRGMRGCGASLSFLIGYTHRDSELQIGRGLLRSAVTGGRVMYFKAKFTRDAEREGRRNSLLEPAS
jgi:hypothetical protein